MKTIGSGRGPVKRRQIATFAIPPAAGLSPIFASLREQCPGLH
jgi:hypothetical protein